MGRPFGPGGGGGRPDLFLEAKTTMLPAKTRARNATWLLENSIPAIFGVRQLEKAMQMDVQTKRRHTLPAEASWSNVGS